MRTIAELFFFFKNINDASPRFAHQTCKILVNFLQNFIYLTLLVWVHSRAFGTVEVLRKGFHISQRTLRPDQSLLFLVYLNPNVIWGMCVNGMQCLKNLWWYYGAIALCHRNLREGRQK